MSKEGILPIESFQIRSAGLGDSGPVTVCGTQGEGGFKALSIAAFGKEYKLDAKQLESLQGLAINGCQLSCEHGYRGVGGRTVYVILSKGFTSGVASQRFVVINESGSIEMRESLQALTTR